METYESHKLKMTVRICPPQLPKKYTGGTMGKQKQRRFLLKKDIVIPAGKIFTNIDGITSHFVSGNYETIIGVTPNNAGRVIFGIEDALKETNEWFQEIIE